MPALGRTIMLEVVEDAYGTMTIDGFRRAYLNIPTAADERVISQAAWEQVRDANVEATGELFAFDCNPERSSAGIVAVGAGPIVEVVDYHPGTGWLIDRICELSTRYHARFAADARGPAGSFIPELRRRGVTIIEVESADMPRAAAAFYDLVIDEQVKVRANADLDSAVAGAAKRPVGDQWAWGRKSSKIDISLLVAASIATWVQPAPVDREPIIEWA